VTQMQLPAYLQTAGLPDFTDRLSSNLGTRAQPYLSIKDDRLTLVDSNGDTEPVLTRDEKTGDPYLDCVIIDAGDVASKIYYGRPYEPGSDSYSPPACWSDNGIAPSISCNEPQAVSCTPDPEGKHGCKLAVWGSGRAREGSKVVPPACSKVQKIAILIPGDDVQFLVRVPPGSLDELSAYNAKFKGHPFTMRDVMTRISIANKTLSFKGLGFIDEGTAKQRNAVLMAKTTDALVGRGDKPRGSVAITSTVPQTSMVNTLPAPIASLPASASAGSVSGPLDATFAATQPTGTAPASTQTAPPAPGVSPSNGAAPTRRRRKTADAPPVGGAHIDDRGPPQGGPVAPFRQAAEPAAPASTSAQHGMASPAAPNAELEAALKEVFG
jgi:hypothetical protein